MARTSGLTDKLNMVLEHVERRCRGESLGELDEDRIDRTYVLALDAFLAVADLRQDHLVARRLCQRTDPRAVPVYGTVDPEAMKKLLVTD